jgi:hypothetical protein
VKSNRGSRPARLGRGAALLIAAGLMSSLVPLRAQTVQLRADAIDEGWGNRQANTSGGKILWFEHDGGANTDDVVLYDGSSASVVQPQGALTNVGDIVFALGTGATAGQVIAAWRRDTDFAWISTDGGAPVPVTATNPGNPLVPLNPEGAGIADGCVFLILQDASGAFPRKYVFKANPATGVATILTDPAIYPVTGSADGAPRITTKGCKAAWRYFDGSSTIKLHFYDGASIAVIDSGDIDLPHMSAGRVVYAKTVDGVSQVYLYDSNLASPAPVALTSYTDPSKVNSYAKTDGRHVAWLRQNTDNSNRQIILNGDMRLTDSASKPPDGGLFSDFPLQLQRGQLLWTDAAGALRYAHDGAIATVDIAPATSMIRPWLADGYVAFTGLSNDLGTDTEPFRYAGVAPSDAVQPSAPFRVSAAHGDAQITLAWDGILGAASYNLYYATVPGVTKDNYGTLPGGTRVASVTSPYTVSGLANGTTYYFVVTAVEGATEGANSPEVSAAPKVPACVSPAGGGCFTALQPALDASSPGDTIRVAEGTYTESTVVGGFTYNFYVDKTVTLEGGWNSTFTVRNPVAHPTILHPSTPSFSVLTVQGQYGDWDAVAPVIDGFTISGGRGDLGGNHGGGVRMRDSSGTVRDCVISGNVSYFLGGGVWVQRGAPRLEGNRIENNGVTSGGSGGGVDLEGTQATMAGNTITGNHIADVAGFGGGVSIDGGGLVALTENTIANNAAANQAGTATDKAYGGGISVNGATVFLTKNLIQGNRGNSTVRVGMGNANGTGGGVYIVNSPAFTLMDNTITGNIAGYQYYVYQQGGGLLIDSSQGELFDNVISSNQANGNILFGDGGGIAALSSTLAIHGGRIDANKTAINNEGYGGGLYAKNSTVTLDAVSITGNAAGNTPFYGMGGGLAFLDSPFTLTNSLVAGNVAFSNDTANGGLFAGITASITTNNSPGTVVNNTFSSNKGQAINVAAAATISNNIIMGSTTGIKLTGAGPVTAKNNDFYNNSIANVSGFTLDSTNIVINPQLDASYIPAFGSAVVDAGTDTGCPSFDLYARSRPVDGDQNGTPACDIGAVELGPLVSAILPSSGPAAGGTSVSISGAFFLNGSTVAIGTAPATAVSVLDSTTIAATTPALAAGVLHDVVVDVPGVQTATLAGGWLADFLDVPGSHPFHAYVEKLIRNGVTAGCSGGNYCPNNSVTRAQMAVFLLRGEHGSSWTPPPASGVVFTDVAANAFAAAWIERLAAEGITGGCGSDAYCPASPVSRAQMAVFLLRTEHGPGYAPPVCTAVFNDVPCPSPFADWIVELFNEGITGGCGGGNYCPNDGVTRGQMAVFLVKTFNLQ